ncbi:MAG TPA: hypothetical protein VJ785_01055 [Anaerolineales bacterium]|nr:hypothetical protein [Anaerolineales bacterium]
MKTNTSPLGLMEIEEQKAFQLVAELAPQAQELREALRVVSVLRGDEVDDVKTNPARTFLPVKILSFSELYDEIGKLKNAGEAI